MGFDDLHKKRQGNLKKRKAEIKELEPLRFLIVCEGEKTECVLQVIFPINCNIIFQLLSHCKF